MGVGCKLFILFNFVPGHHIGLKNLCAIVAEILSTPLQQSLQFRYQFSILALMGVYWQIITLSSPIGSIRLCSAIAL